MGGGGGLDIDYFFVGQDQNTLNCKLKLIHCLMLYFFGLVLGGKFCVPPKNSTYDLSSQIVKYLLKYRMFKCPWERAIERQRYISRQRDREKNRQKNIKTEDAS